MGTETLQHRLFRYAIVATIFGVLGVLFVRQQTAARDAEAGVRTNVEANSAADLQLGVAPPDIVLETRDGKRFQLSEARGKVVVLNFWATWCAPCREEMPTFEQTYRERGQDVLFVGVNTTSVDSKPEAIEFADRLGITFPIIFDAQGKASEAYGVRGLPATFFIGADGTLKAKALGPVFKDRLQEQLRVAGAP